MTGLPCGTRAIAHELYNSFLLRRQAAVKSQNFVHLFFKLYGPDLGRRRRAELVAAIQSKRLDAVPMGRKEARGGGLPVRKREGDRLPAVRIHNLIDCVGGAVKCVIRVWF